MSRKTKRLEAQLEGMQAVCLDALERERRMAYKATQHSLTAVGYKRQVEDAEAATRVLMALSEKRDAQAGDAA